MRSSCTWRFVLSSSCRGAPWGDSKRDENRRQAVSVLPWLLDLRQVVARV